MDETGLSHHLETEDLVSPDGGRDEGVSEKEFLRALIKTLLFAYVAAIGGTLYIQYRQNVLLSFVTAGIVQIWCHVLLWAISLAVPTQGYYPRWGVRAFWLALVLLWTVSAVGVSTASANAWDQDIRAESNLEYVLYRYSTAWTQSLAIVSLSFVLWYIRLQLKAFHEHDHDKMQRVSMQSVDAVLRVGIIQIALATTALVAFGSHNFSDDIIGAGERLSYEGHFLWKSETSGAGYYELDVFKLPGMAWPAYLAWKGGDLNDYLSDFNFTSLDDDFSFHTNLNDTFTTLHAEGYTEYNATSKMEDEQAVSDSLHGVQAGLTGGILNIFLIQSIVAKQVLRLGLVDVLKGRVTWLECLLALLQLVITVTVAAIVSFSAEDFSAAWTSPSTLADFKEKRLAIFGLAIPGLIVLLLDMYFARALQDSESATGNLLRSRHKRIAKLEYLVMQGEHHQNQLTDSLKKDLEDQKQRLDDSVTVLESRISLMGGELERKLDQSMQGRSPFLDDSSSQCGYATS